jgi:hypothetical protein
MVPESVTSKLNCTQLRLLFNWRKLICFTAKGYEGFNPEAQGQTSSNADTHRSGATKI